MRYRILYTALSLVTLLAVCSCNSCSNDSKKGKGGGINPKVQQLDETPDEAILVKLEKITDDSLYVYNVDDKSSDKSLEAFSYGVASANGTIHGSLKVGNNFSIFPKRSTKEVEIAINVTELQGRWIYNQQQHRGIDFNNGGGMSSINSEKICFREWKLLNGKFYVYYIDMQETADDRQKFQVEEAYIMHLDDKRLVLLFQGETYDCARPSSKPLMLN